MLRTIYYSWPVLCIALGLMLFVGVSVGQAESNHDNDPETTEVVAKLTPAGAMQIEVINGAYGTTTVEVLVGSSNIYRLRVPNGADAESTAERLQDDARVLYAEPNYTNEAPEGNPRHIGAWGGPNNNRLSEQYAFDLLGLPDAHQFKQGENVIVAVLDTGFQLNHPDLADRWTATRYDFIDDDDNPSDVADGEDNDGDGYVDEAMGHGTHVSGIVHMTAPNASIMPVRVLEADGRGNIFVIAEAIQYAMDNGADIISLSLGSAQESELMKDILEEAIEQHDVVVVAAAGNLNSRAKQFPASEDEVLAVTSIDLNSRKSDFANYGEWIDVAAPGEAILSAFPVNDQATWSGTSMAVPFVSGHAALLRSAVPSMSAAEVMAYIRASAQPLDALNPGLAGELGAGRINVGGSIRAICAEDGTCNAPDIDDKLVLESRALIASRPAASLTGTWIIGNHTFVADGNTEFRQGEGALAVGACAGVEYWNTSPYTALEIRSREADKCADSVTVTAPDTVIHLPLIAR